VGLELKNMNFKELKIAMNIVSYYEPLSIKLFGKCYRLCSFIPIEEFNKGIPELLQFLMDVNYKIQEAFENDAKSAKKPIVKKP
jgi:hypothetical protein